jgi:hypothetical protein
MIAPSAFTHRLRLVEAGWLVEALLALVLADLDLPPACVSSRGYVAAVTPPRPPPPHKKPSQRAQQSGAPAARAGGGARPAGRASEGRVPDHEVLV